LGRRAQRLLRRDQSRADASSPRRATTCKPSFMPVGPVPAGTVTQGRCSAVQIELNAGSPVHGISMTARTSAGSWCAKARTSPSRAAIRSRQGSRQVAASSRPARMRARVWVAVRSASVSMVVSRGVGAPATERQGREGKGGAAGAAGPSCSQ